MLGLTLGKLGGYIVTSFFTAFVALLFIGTFEMGYYFSTGGSVNPDGDISSGNTEEFLFNEAIFIGEYIRVLASSNQEIDTTENISVYSFNDNKQVFNSCVGYDLKIEEGNSKYISGCDSGNHLSNEYVLVGYFNHSDINHYTISNNESYEIFVVEGLQFPLFEDNWVEDFYIFFFNKAMYFFASIIIYIVGVLIISKILGVRK